MLIICNESQAVCLLFVMNLMRLCLCACLFCLASESLRCRCNCWGVARPRGGAVSGERENRCAGDGGIDHADTDEVGVCEV
jgi:hypothetical protein